jgi:hypothetical protein
VNLLRLVSDVYEQKARLYPALVLVTPIIVTIIAIASVKLSAAQSLAVLVVGCGGTFLLAQLARDAGKKGEQGLFASWGGMPSVAIMRHRDTRIDPITKARYHKKLSALVKGAKPPSPAEEQADHAGADVIYQAWSTYLRVSTRDAKKYSLLFQENVSYGYRRNLWGLRAWGIITSTLSCLIAASWSVRQYRASDGTSVELLAATALALILLVLWVFRFTSTWVRVPADAYAERLAEAVDALGGKSTGAKETKVSPSKKQ